MKHLIYYAILCVITQYGYSQDLIGMVHDAEDMAILPGAIVRIVDTDKGASANEGGYFTIPLEQSDYPISVYVLMTGYQQDTITIDSPLSKPIMIHLRKSETIEGVVIQGNQPATTINSQSGQQLESLNAKELTKAACCNLSETFTTNASVDVVYSDAVTGSKQIRFLGLQGIYSQINQENMPLIRGLGEYYGMSLVPGPWIEQIHLGKGTGSVSTGFEAMAGQINVQFIQPDGEERIFVNGYQNAQGRSELNGYITRKLNDKWSTALLAHGSLVSGDVDQNNDSFNDRNKGGQVNLFSRWKYGGESLRAQFGVKYAQDEKVGGQVGFRSGDDSSPANRYGVDVKTTRIEAFTKTGFILDDLYKSIALITNVSKHNQQAIFGSQQLDSEQNSIYANLIYQTILSNTMHKIKLGASYQYDEVEETLAGENSSARYSIPGVFTEYDYDNLRGFQLIAGLRADHINTQSQFTVSPRLHAKYEVNDDFTIRATGGRGFRVPNLYADMPGMLVSSRNIVSETPQVETSWNMGASATSYFMLGGREGSIVLDAYRTIFENQVFRDFYSSKNETFISNLSNSYANSVQLTVDYEIIERLNTRLAYKREDVKQKIQGEYIQQMLVPTHRGLANLDYETLNELWRFDATMQYVGKQRLPSTAIHEDALQHAVYSKDYALLNAQATRTIGKYDVYIGSENIGNFTQQNPIVDAENPFGNQFDALSIWGPIMGTNVYAGFRYNILKDNKQK